MVKTVMHGNGVLSIALLQQRYFMDRLIITAGHSMLQHLRPAVSRSWHTPPDIYPCASLLPHFDFHKKSDPEVAFFSDLLAGYGHY